MAGATQRLAHVAQLKPEICTLDCGTMNFAAGGDYVMANTPQMLRAMAAHIRALGVRPELEVFDYGQLVMVKDLIDEGLIETPVMVQACMGIRYGAPDDPGSLLGLVSLLPPGTVFSAFSVGRMQLPYVAMAVLAGGNVRVGLEDDLDLGSGEKATNGQLVERAATILKAMNVRVLGPGEVRDRLVLRRRADGAHSPERWAARRWGDRRRLGGAACARGGRCAAVRSVSRRERVARAQIDLGRQAWRRLRSAPLLLEGRLTVADTVAEAVAGAELVQESAPGRETLKRALLAEASRAASPDAIIATSTSGLLPSHLCSEKVGAPSGWSSASPSIRCICFLWYRCAGPANVA